MKLKSWEKHILSITSSHPSGRHLAGLGLAAGTGPKEPWRGRALSLSGPGILFRLFCARYLLLPLVFSLVIKTNKPTQTSAAVDCSPSLASPLAGDPSFLQVTSLLHPL